MKHVNVLGVGALNLDLIFEVDELRSIAPKGIHLKPETERNVYDLWHGRCHDAVVFKRFCRRTLFVNLSGTTTLAIEQILMRLTGVRTG